MMCSTWTRLCTSWMTLELSGRGRCLRGSNLCLPSSRTGGRRPRWLLRRLAAISRQQPALQMRPRLSQSLLLAHVQSLPLEAHAHPQSPISSTFAISRTRIPKNFDMLVTYVLVSCTYRPSCQRPCPRSSLKQCCRAFASSFAYLLWSPVQLLVCLRFQALPFRPFALEQSR